MFALRVDIDTRKGMIEGVPALLELLDTYDIPASFYVPVGGESTLLDVLKYRETVGDFDQDHIEKLTFAEKLRTVLHPQDFAMVSQDVLQRAAADDHEVGIHGLRHRRWTRGLERLDLDAEFRAMKERYRAVMGEDAESFAAPGFRTSERVLAALDRHGFAVASDLDGDQPFHPTAGDRICDHVQVPVTVREGNMPPIEAWRLDGADDAAIIDRFRTVLDEGGLCSTYIHPAYEAMEELELLEQLFQLVEDSGVERKTYAGIARAQ